MKVKYPVAASVRTTVRNGLEFLAIAFAIVLPLLLIPFILINIDIPTWEKVACGVTGTLIWWYFCWSIFWLIT